jgi:hypothetical protein
MVAIIPYNFKGKEKLLDLPNIRTKKFKLITVLVENSDFTHK